SCSAGDPGEHDGLGDPAQRAGRVDHDGVTDDSDLRVAMASAWRWVQGRGRRPVADTPRGSSAARLRREDDRGLHRRALVVTRTFTFPTCRERQGSAMLTGHPSKLAALLAASGLMTGCAQSGPFTSHRMSMGTLKASVSHLEHEN